MPVFFPCKFIFLDHKYTIRFCVCLDGKKRICAPNLILKVCVSSMQTVVVVLLHIWIELVCCGGKTQVNLPCGSERMIGQVIYIFSFIFSM